MQYVWYSPKYDQLEVNGCPPCNEYKSCKGKCTMYRLDFSGDFKPDFDGQTGVSATQLPLIELHYVGDL